jgi:hypothetical protein
MHISIQVRPILIAGGILCDPAAERGRIVASAKVDEASFSAFARKAPGRKRMARELLPKGTIAIGFARSLVYWIKERNKATAMIVKRDIGLAS